MTLVPRGFHGDVSAVADTRAIGARSTTSSAATSGALFGFAITSLAVLFALTRSDAVKRLRKFRAWTLLNQSLLVAAALLAFALIFSTLALAIDSRSPGCLWLQIPVAAFSVASIAELLVAGVGFAMVIWEVAADQGGG